MFPVIPVLCLGGFILSGLGLTWYENLSKESKDDADRLAADLALRLYSTSIENLTPQQLRVIGAQVQRSLDG